MEEKEKAVFVRRIVKIGNTYYVSIPKSIAELLSLKEKDQVKVVIEKA